MGRCPAHNPVPGPGPPGCIVLPSGRLFHEMTRTEIENSIGELFASDRHSGATAVFLFGSWAREAARPDSDVDVAILLERDPPPTFEGLCLDLEGRSNRESVFRCSSSS